jgi:hypothetical protein
MLASGLVGAKDDGVKLLKKLIEKLNTNQRYNLARALAEDGKDGVSYLGGLLSDDKLPKFQLKGMDYEASKKKALELLGKNTPEALTELRGLIPRS